MPPQTRADKCSRHRSAERGAKPSFHRLGGMGILLRFGRILRLVLLELSTVSILLQANEPRWAQPLTGMTTARRPAAILAGIAGPVIVTAPTISNRRQGRVRTTAHAARICARRTGPEGIILRLS